MNTSVADHLCAIFIYVQFMASPVDILSPVHLKEVLVHRKIKGMDRDAELFELSGGVSCRTFLVRNRGKDIMVLKQALPRLKTEINWYSDPSRIYIEADAIRALGTLCPGGKVPALIFEEKDLYLIGMEAVPQPHDNWKKLLLQGIVSGEYINQFAVMLADIHSNSWQRTQLRQKFDNRQFFQTLRLDPYYHYTAKKCPESANFLRRLMKDTWDNRDCLVHGDFSPKNILIHKDSLVLLDHEVLHYGDGSFDIGFALTHLIAKSVHVQESRQDFQEAAIYFWKTYCDHFSVSHSWSDRAVRHTIGCVLSRIYGKSPLEYLRLHERQIMSRNGLAWINKPPCDIVELIESLSYDYD